ncbi:glycosyltransferase family 4 protein [Campylobacter mucosalis]|uniref:glycosyltransferase family 4 protein n=1 Tax=Campylobacter mucosalis TaxID=202 RepID=UPI00146FF556|nr:glycosyltransferase family 4 protein [Campylobacter mucosalis]
MKIFIIGSIASMMINFRRELILELVSQNHEVYCLTSDYDEKSKEIIRSFGAIPLDYDLNAKGLNPFKDIKATINLIKLLKHHKPDIVFSFFVKPVIFGTIAAKFAGVKRKVGMIEGLGNAFTPLLNERQKIKTNLIKSVQILLYKFSLPLLDRLILLNNDDKADLIDRYKINLKSLEILGPIGVDLIKFSHQRPLLEPVSFIFIARLLAQKGIFEYINAAKIIKERYPNVKFYVYGDADENNPFSIKKDELEEYIKNDIIIYRGGVNDIEEKIKNTSVFVLPSYYREGFPRSTQEAMAIGRAVITTNVPGCKDSIKDGVNGFLIPPFDVKILADKMEIFIKNPDLIEKMGKESRAIAENNFDVFKINKRLITLILENSYTPF